MYQPPPCKMYITKQPQQQKAVRPLRMDILEMLRYYLQVCVRQICTSQHPDSRAFVQMISSAQKRLPR
jgi:hypothetical protein